MRVESVRVEFVRVEPVNATALKFGYPGSLLAEYEHWLVLLRPVQVTLGSLVLLCTDEAGSFGDISPAASTELQSVTSRIEGVLAEAFRNDKINYLMLMMVDPDVHFHVLPRYQSERVYEGVDFSDPDWPGPPQITRSHELASEVLESLTRDLRTRFGELSGAGPSATGA
jgi:diadenosine tetraphosphate (Ap4A) HIT family hydrolase